MEPCSETDRIGGNCYEENYGTGGSDLLSFYGGAECLSGENLGSGFGKTVSALKPSAPSAEIIEGKILNKHATDSDFAAVAALG